MQLTPGLIQAILEENEPAQRVFVAFSGGLDSTVLLHLCTRLDAYQHKLKAVYVHHGLQDAADAWAIHCARVAESFEVNFLQLDVDARPVQGQSPEETARNQRYGALEPLLEEGDLLLTGQHLEDQMETMLLQLFRGAGLSGLSSMPVKMQFGKGWLLRPLLTVPRKLIQEYAQSNGLCWVEDPSNKDVGYDRNFLRNQIIPLLKDRWPAIATTVSRSAAHCAEAQQYIDGTVSQPFSDCFDSINKTIFISQLRRYDIFLQQQIIRHWFSHLNFRMPSSSLLQRILSGVIAAGEQSMPLVQNKEVMVRRYRDRLYLMTEQQSINVKARYPWPMKKDQLRLPGNGCLTMTVTNAAGISRQLWEQGDIEVCYRQGGEKMALPNREGRHSLKKLFQKAAIPPWQRETIPLIYIDDQLAAVAGLWVSRDFLQNTEKNNVEIKWNRYDGH